MSTKRFLFLVKRMARSEADLWLTDEMIFALADRNMVVDVLLFDLTGTWEEGRIELRKNVTLYCYRLLDRQHRRGLINLVRLIFAWLRAIVLCRSVIRQSTYDVVVNFSIASIFAGVAGRVKRNTPHAKSLLVLWDFFPVHQLEIGKIKSRLLGKLLYAIERREVFTADFVGLMSQRNLDFFRSYHPGYSGKAFRLPVWGRQAKQQPISSSRRGKDDNSSLKVIFGGQLSRGRGITRVVDVADRYRRELRNVEISIFGDGELLPELQDKIEQSRLNSVTLLGRLDRPQYLERISCADVGLVVTVPNVSVPTFPSKVIDYMRARLPIVAWVESCTDFGEFVENEAKCGYFVDAEDISGFVAILQELRDQKADGRLRILGDNGHRYFLQNLEVSRVVDRMLNEIGIF